MKSFVREVSDGGNEVVRLPSAIVSAGNSNFLRRLRERFMMPPPHLEADE